MKIISYNVNGIRAASTKNFFGWLQATNADMVCLQEVKALPEQITEIIALIEQLGYHHFWFPAQKKGYSGVAILTKIEPNRVVFGCGEEWIDQEGRILRADFDDFSLMSLYMPSGSSGDERQVKKYEFMRFFDAYIGTLRQEIPNLIVSGDYNICHTSIDIHNPKSNANSSGFLPEERKWMQLFLDNGFIDTFRYFNQDPHHYTWWSYRAGSRGKNLGWRIDYHLVTRQMESRLKNVRILPDAIHSDHCPVLLEID
ncbi:exodeoxyribonuclease-3 [Pedobacter psychrotolerans]|uniref:Exodeoxyribonuclease III n=1 Tax=Pedobacter psychrotolerans TaxID=1843235 RepID=A0A4R2HIY3_9SPHI|nr:exodeoxyribonuclease III [Pedobacter psychrotolerans]TCO26933.1 exodeoxyribonuclease-3 [Pedobacter psychrotolerans]GGE57628.1 exodeoxyribonuclease III [Pedobacter psychrotolerans]